MNSASENIEVQQVSATLRARGRALLRVGGNSMMPWLRPGDLLFVRKAQGEKVNCGEVVVFSRGARLIVHRVIRTRGLAGQPVLLTKGDAVADADDPVSRAELLGKVEWIVRNGRRIPLRTARQMALGRLLSWISPASRRVYPIARAAMRLLHLLRHSPRRAKLSPASSKLT